MLFNSFAPRPHRRATTNRILRLWLSAKLLRRLQFKVGAGFTLYESVQELPPWSGGLVDVDQSAGAVEIGLEHIDCRLRLMGWFLLCADGERFEKYRQSGCRFCCCGIDFCRMMACASSLLAFMLKLLGPESTNPLLKCSIE